MSEQIYLITILLLLGTILTIFGLKYGSAAYQARAARPRPPTASSHGSP
jgi:hypothetical protein